MILYFANRKMEILGHASNKLRRGFVIKDDLKTEDVDTGVTTFTCKVGYDKKSRRQLEEMTRAGNFLLARSDGENKFYTIIDKEFDTKSKEVYIYAEDAGLELLNEMVGEFKATEAHTADWYVEDLIGDSGFEIGINEIPASRVRTLSWEGEATKTERLASIATQFGGFEVSYTFRVRGLYVTNKYINIYQERGKNTEEQLRLNFEIDRIITKESVANLATALKVTGGIPEGKENPITLEGYEYDDGDFYVDGTYLKCRSALKKWGRFVKKDSVSEGHIEKPYSYDTTSQSELCNRAITELKKVCDMEINYEVDINELPKNIKVGDRVNIIDDEGELYLSTRILLLETSETQNTQKATLGEHLIKTGGISLKVEELASQFVSLAKSSAKAKVIADEAKKTADGAKLQSDNALAESEEALQKANDAEGLASQANESAAQAQEASSNALTQAGAAQEKVASLEKEVEEVQETAGNAKSIAEGAESKALEAQQAAQSAQSEADEAAQKALEAQNLANAAQTGAENAQSAANEAKANAEEVKATVENVKTEVEQAKKDLENLDLELETLSQTMSADYAKKTELTEVEANLQTQISQNADEISSTAAKVVKVDETANDAAAQALAAQQAAQAAQEQANTATTDAQTAQQAADAAALAAQAAQQEADNAKALANTAQEEVNNAEAELAKAQADLAEVTTRVGATEEEIEAAQTAVNTAQAAADKAKQDAANAATAASNAQSTADTAKTNAANAQSAADQANAKALAAQQAAENAQGSADAAQETANQAKQTAETAQTVATTAKNNAAAAQSTADDAAEAAEKAQQAADDADTKAVQAAADLATAKANLAQVTSRVDATEEDIAAAEAAVASAQAAANAAQADADAAQATANTAKTNAANAQTAADNAKTAADNAQKAADDAQDAADAAQAAADALAVRVTNAETKITQNSEQIALRATKSEVASTLAGYYTKTQTEAAIKVEADKISGQVSSLDGRMTNVEQTAEGLSVSIENSYQKGVSRGEQLVTNGNGLLGDNTNFSAWTFDGAVANNSPGSFTLAQGVKKTIATDEFFPVSTDNEYTFALDVKSKYGLATIYSMLLFYDADKNEIVADHHMYNADSTTTLAQDLKKGDTVIYLTDASGWSTSYSYGYYLTIWDWVNSFGYKYPAETYTRHRLTLPKTSSNKLNSSCLNKTANTITLTSAYSGATIPAGTAVSQGSDGANYKYTPLSNTLIGTEWKRYSGKISGVDYSGKNKGSMFPPGTAYAKVAFTWNYNTADDQLWITNVVVTDSTSVSAALTAANNAQADATDAAKTATNYLDFSSAGLIIGDMTASVLGNNVLIDTDSLCIRKGTNILASFGANLIELGKNAAETVISLCGDKATMRVKDGYFTTESDWLHYIASKEGDGYSYVIHDSIAEGGSTTAKGQYESIAFAMGNTTYTETHIRALKDGTSVAAIGVTDNNGTGEILIFGDAIRLSGDIASDINFSASAQNTAKALKWGTINSKAPYIGYAKDQNDGTFLWSITGTNYQSGLAIGGGSGNLLWKGARVLTVDDLSSIGSGDYLPLSGGNITGHIYLTGAKETSSTGNTSQIVFGTSSDNHIAITSNRNCLVLNPSTSTTSNSTTGASQVVIYLNKESKFPKGIQANITGNLTGTASKATADANGNNIASTYATITSVTTMINNAIGGAMGAYY